jgi:hypothetical protein
MLIELSNGTMGKDIVAVNSFNILLRVGNVDDMSGIWVVQIF